jgi:hypothetical protein
MQKVEQFAPNICDSELRQVSDSNGVRCINPNEMIIPSVCVEGELKGASCEKGGFLGYGNTIVDATCPNTTSLVTAINNFKYCVNDTSPKIGFSKCKSPGNYITDIKSCGVYPITNRGVTSCPKIDITTSQIGTDSNLYQTTEYTDSDGNKWCI